jgi:hypothetical protein
MTEQSKPSVLWARIAIGAAGVAFLGLLVWASFTGDIGQEFAVMMAMPWGQVSIADLYLGFFLYALIVFLVEEKRLVACFWALPIFVLGNVWAALWLVLRLPTIIARLSPKQP